MKKISHELFIEHNGMIIVFSLLCLRGLTCPTIHEYRDLTLRLPHRLRIQRRRVSSVVEHSSANPKVPSSIPGLVSYQGHGL